jgi:hypothetical protein
VSGFLPVVAVVRMLEMVRGGCLKNMTTKGANVRNQENVKTIKAFSEMVLSQLLVTVRP